MLYASEFTFNHACYVGVSQKLLAMNYSCIQSLDLTSGHLLSIVNGHGLSND